MEIKIKKSEYLTSAVDQKQWIQDETPEVCFVGKSNVGKSSFINALLNRKKLAYVASTPGKTRMLNFYDVELMAHHLRVVDAPGYGFAKISAAQDEQFKKMMDQYLTQRSNLKLICLLIDLRHVPSKNDVQMYEYLAFHKLPIMIVATKEDKVKRNDIAKNLKVIRQTLQLHSDVVMVATSSEAKKGLEACWEQIINVIS